VFPFVAECSVSLNEALALSGLPMAAIFMASVPPCGDGGGQGRRVEPWGLCGVGSCWRSTVRALAGSRGWVSFTSLLSLCKFLA
jgi:hypothetical protein